MIPTRLGRSAMQKVVGSSPIIRSKKTPLSGVLVGRVGYAEALVSGSRTRLERDWLIAARLDPAMVERSIEAR